MFLIKTRSHFDAAHFLSGHGGKCRNIHGHRWTVEAAVTGEIRRCGEDRGMVADFSVLKRTLNALCDDFDHTLIYEKGSLSEDLLAALQSEDFALTEVPFRPTAELLARHFYRKLSDAFVVSSVTVCETPENIAVYTENTEGTQ
jgi:6-pyruvoyltetrahydropterin/6-carboxytetrahydropterin synthase